VVPFSPQPTQTELPTGVWEREDIRLHSPLAKHMISDLPGLVSSPYTGPSVGDDARHHGVDFCYFPEGEEEFIEGAVIQAILPGKVVSVQEDTMPYGHMVMIETPSRDLPPGYFSWLEIHAGESLYHLYAHLQDAPGFRLGENVEGGQMLGRVGRTGYYIVVPHLHLETRIGPSGAEFEGLAYYDPDATEEERAAYEMWRTSGSFKHFDPMRLFLTYLEGIETSSAGKTQQP
jgi:murein DD-endopeptidase MepM/ murein hydrolase activator NlpD